MAKKRSRSDDGNKTKAKKQKTKSAVSTPKVQRGFMGARGEAKYFDRGTLATLMSSTLAAAVVHINAVPQGTGVTQRDGRMAQMTSVQLRGNVIGPPAANLSQGIMYLVYDAQVNKALPAITDVLDTHSALSLPRRENTSRFKFIKKWRWNCAGHLANSGTQAPCDSSIHDIDEYVRLPSYCLTEWTSTDTTGVIGNCVKGALYLVITGTGIDASTAPQLSLYPRVNFKDL